MGPPNREQLTAFVERRTGAAPHAVHLRTRPLRGGLMASCVTQVSARYTDRGGRRRTTDFVVKQLDAGLAREADVYAALATAQAGVLAPDLLHVERSSDDADAAIQLYLERIVPAERWPWRDVRFTAAVLEHLAALHASEHADSLKRSTGGWDYESELQQRSFEALTHVERFGAAHGDREVRASLPALRRLLTELPRVREQLAGDTPLSPAVLHGDVHPGNVLVRSRAGAKEPVFLDWGRARIGSPLEDVSSWLQSLGFWEPEAKRKHDTLLRTYLAARGLPGHPSRAARDAYWLAAASNCLAGALCHHLGIAASAERRPRDRHVAIAAAHHCLRVIRRADACWRA